MFTVQTLLGSEFALLDLLNKLLYIIHVILASSPSMRLALLRIRRSSFNYLLFKIPNFLWVSLCFLGALKKRTLIAYLVYLMRKNHKESKEG